MEGPFFKGLQNQTADQVLLSVKGGGGKGG